MVEIVIFVIIWLSVGYASAILTLLALNGMLIENDWKWAFLVCLLGPIQGWIFMRATKEVN